MKKLNLRRQVADILEIPPEIALNACQLILTGPGHIRAENHQGIIEYLPQGIIFKTSDGKIQITGQNLSLAALNQDSLSIEGQIETISLLNT